MNLNMNMEESAMPALNYADAPFFLNAGPTALPPRVVAAGSQPMISHRSETFHQLYAELLVKARQILLTQGDLFFLTSSGSGGLEASVSNFIAPGQKVLVASIGNFGDKYRDIAQAAGAEVEYLAFPWGRAIDPQVIADKLRADTRHEIKAVLFTQHETSTGVYNPVEAIAAARGDHPALLLVDAISGLAACPLKTDEWGLDVVVASSQKALMTPPGLALITVSERAWASFQEQGARHYFNLRRYQQSAAKNETPETPAVSLMFAMNEAASMILEQGLDDYIAAHYRHRDAVRAGLKALGLALVADDRCAGGAITSFYLPENIQPAAMLKLIATKYDTVLCGGLGQLSAHSLRFAHVGYVRDMDIVVGLAALELALKEAGYPLTLGNGLAACQEALYAARN